MKEINLIRFYRETEKTEKDMRLRKALLSIRSQCKEKNIEISIGASSLLRVSETEKNAAEEAEQALLIRFYKGWNHVFYYEEAGHSRQSYLKPEMEHIFRISLENVNDKGCCEILDLCFHEIENSVDLSILRVCATIRELFFICSKVICSQIIPNAGFGCIGEQQKCFSFATSLDNMNHKIDFDIHCLRHYANFDHLHKALRQYVGMLCDYILSEKNQDRSSIINDLIQYINHHFREEIQLEDLARERYFVNSSYLSRLF